MISTVDGKSRWNNSIKLISANFKFKIDYLNCKLTHILIKNWREIKKTKENQQKHKEKKHLCKAVLLKQRKKKERKHDNI